MLSGMLFTVSVWPHHQTAGQDVAGEDVRRLRKTIREKPRSAWTGITVHAAPAPMTETRMAKIARTTMNDQMLS